MSDAKSEEYLIKTAEARLQQEIAEFKLNEFSHPFVKHGAIVYEETVEIWNRIVQRLNNEL